MLPIARVGDTCSHGPAIITGSPNVFVNGIPLARVTDTYGCPYHVHFTRHGPNPIVTGSPRFTANGLPVARVTDMTACGANIVQGSPNTFEGG